MRIEIFGARSAPQLEETRGLVDEAVAESGATDAEVIIVAVEGPEDARAKKSFGTPTVRVNGLSTPNASRRNTRPAAATMRRRKVGSRSLQRG
jgi:hypothetical protein